MKRIYIPKWNIHCDILRKICPNLSDNRRDEKIYDAFGDYDVDWKLSDDKKDHKIEADNDDFGNYYENFSDNWRDHETDAGGFQQETERVGTDQGGQA